MQKVTELNLEYGMPTVEQALVRLKNGLLTARGMGCRAVIVIHGYGSSGTGGSIKAAVAQALAKGALSGMVRLYGGGEGWFLHKRELLQACGQLREYERRIAGNQGVTVIILK